MKYCKYKKQSQEGVLLKSILKVLQDSQTLRQPKKRFRHRCFPVDFAKSLQKHLFCKTGVTP